VRQREAVIHADQLDRADPFKKIVIEKKVKQGN
jgi:hypothetical protein